MYLINEIENFAIKNELLIFARVKSIELHCLKTSKTSVSPKRSFAILDATPKEEKTNVAH